jgi:hypothetical protein
LYTCCNEERAVFLHLMKIFIVASLVVAGMVYAEAPDIIIVDDYHQNGAVILDSGNSNSPPPLVIVNGQVVGHDAIKGPPDCSIAENRPICQTIQYALDVNPCGWAPVAIILNQEKGTIYFKCGLLGMQPPDVWINGQCVNCN